MVGLIVRYVATALTGRYWICRPCFPEEANNCLVYGTGHARVTRRMLDAAWQRIGRLTMRTYAHKSGRVLRLRFELCTDLSASESAIGDDPRDPLRRSDVEGGISHPDTRRRDLDATDGGDLVRRSLLDRDLASGRDAHVHGRERRCDVQRAPVLVHEASDPAGSDLVGGVAVPRDPIRTDDGAVDRVLRQQMR